MGTDSADRKPDSDGPPSSEPDSGDEVKLFQAVRLSDLRNLSADDAAAISVRAPAMPPQSLPPIVTPIPGDPYAFDPMRSYALPDSTPPPSGDQTAVLGAVKSSRTRLLAAPTTTPHDAVGRTVAGKYAVRRLLGEGGMATVLEAIVLGTQQLVAVKVMRGDFARNPEIIARFEREARAAATVKSPHIVRMIDVGRDDAIGLFMVMELLAGEDMGALLAREARLAPRVACALAWQAAEGLARAHEGGVLHRDIKPANLFLSRGADDLVTLKLLDFGVAKLDDAPAGEGLTRVGTVLGTPQYMSPEQARARPMTPKTDVFSLGAVLFELLSGRPLVSEHETLQETLYIAATQVPPAFAKVLPGADPRLARLIDDMLCSDPALRVDMQTVCRRLLEIYPDASRPPRASDLNGRGATTERKLRASAAASAATEIVVTAPREASKAATSKRKAPLPAWVPIVIGTAVALMILVVVAVVRRM
jgi:serine/threonine-protein kinase